MWRMRRIFAFLVTVLVLLSGLAESVDAANRMYWTEASGNMIRRANLDGTDAQDLVTTGVVNSLGIALDLGGSKMYWAEADGRKIQRANLDGTGVETGGRSRFLGVLETPR